MSIHFEGRGSFSIPCSPGHFFLVNSVERFRVADSFPRGEIFEVSTVSSISSSMSSSSISASSSGIVETRSLDPLIESLGTKPVVGSDFFYSGERSFKQ